MGTAYIVSARSDRSNATAMSAANNIQLARDAVMSQMVQVLGTTGSIDSAGQMYGYGSGSGPASRYYDYPETGTTYGQATNNTKVPDEPWLAAGFHNHGAVADTYFKNGQNLYDPATGLYDIPINAAATASYSTNVVNEQTAAGSDPYDAVSNLDGINATTSDSILNLLPFSDASGIRYRFGIRIVDTNRMANLNTGATEDGAATGDTFGTNIASLRLAPGSGFTNYFKSTDTAANLHIATGGLGRAGTSGSAFTLGTWESLVLGIENPSTVNPLFALFDSSDELELRSYGEFGTSYTARPSASAVWPKTLGNLTGSAVTGNPARRNYTTYSFSRLSRPYPDPAGGAFTLTYAAGTYADGSPFAAPTDFLKDFGVYNVSAPQATDVGTASHIWPTAPWDSTSSKSYPTALPRIPINPPLAVDTSVAPPQSLQRPSKQNWTAMYHLAATATNIATAMERVSGFAHREACGFAANYVASMWSGILQDPDVVVTNERAYYFPTGPSFVDDSGICVRTAINAGLVTPPTDASITQIAANFGGNGTDLSAGASAGGTIYLGYVAQPFFNKIAAQSTSDGAGNGASSITLNDFAIELFNPYSVALSMRDYHLFDSASNKDIPLTQDDNGQKLYVPPGGYLIITNGTGTPPLAPTPSGSPPSVVVAKYSATNLPVALSTGSTLSLRRLFIDRTFTSQLATVDRANYTAVDTPNTIFAPSGTAGLVSLYTGRADFSNATMSAPLAASTSSPPGYTLGATAGSPAYNIYDRSTFTSSSPTPIANIADFNRIMRIGTVVDNTGTPVTTSPVGLLTERLVTLGTAPDSAQAIQGTFRTKVKKRSFISTFGLTLKFFQIPLFTQRLPHHCPAIRSVILVPLSYLIVLHQLIVITPQILLAHRMSASIDLPDRSI